MKRAFAFILSAALIFSFAGCGNTNNDTPSETNGTGTTTDGAKEDLPMNISDEFVLIKGGTFQMGSPEDEPWRSADETQHSVTVSDFYMSKYELTQKEYAAVTGKKPSSFSGGDLPVENVSWLDAVAYCNARSEAEGLTSVYTMDGQNVSWDRSANEIGRAHV